MNKNKKIAQGFFIGAIFFYIVAAITFLSRVSSSTMWIMFMFLGYSWVAIGGFIVNKQKNKSDDNSSNNQGK